MKLILSDGGEALLLGGTRPTVDLDFGLHIARRRLWPAVEEAVAEAARDARVTVQYSQDLDRCSEISIPKAKLKTRPFRRIGRLTVHLLEPSCWAVYKLARYLDTDVSDLVAVLRREKTPPMRLARLCGEALRSSPRSPSLFVFRRQVEHFFREHGMTIWGKCFDAGHATAIFHRAAGIRQYDSTRIVLS